MLLAANWASAVTWPLLAVADQEPVQAMAVAWPLLMLAVPWPSWAFVDVAAALKALEALKQTLAVAWLVLVWAALWPSWVFVAVAALKALVPLR